MLHKWLRFRCFHVGWRKSTRGWFLYRFPLHYDVIKSEIFGFFIDFSIFESSEGTLIEYTSELRDQMVWKSPDSCVSRWVDIPRYKVFCQTPSELGDMIWLVSFFFIQKKKPYPIPLGNPPLKVLSNAMRFLDLSPKKKVLHREVTESFLIDF